MDNLGIHIYNKAKKLAKQTLAFLDTAVVDAQVALSGGTSSPQYISDIHTGYHGRESLRRYEKYFSPPARVFLENTGIPKPEYVVRINGKTFLLSCPYRSKNLYNDHAMMYVLEGDYLSPRMLYFSNSGQNRHCSPGLRSDGNISKGTIMKGYSYEKSTCVHESISHCLSRARMQSGYSTDPIDLSKDVYGTATFQDNGYTRSSHHILYDQYNTETNIDTRILDINRGRPDVFAEMPDDISKNNVISLYKKLKIPRGLELGSCITPWKCGARQNPLGNIYERKVYVSYNGHDMVCTVKYGDTDKSSIRIDSLEYKNIPINTFGIRSHQINLGLFGAKPLEYTTQVPNDVAEKNHTLHGYTDIRDIINHSPLHQKLKKIVFSENIRKNDSINSYKLGKSVYIPRSKSQPTKARVAGIGNIRVDLQNGLSYYIQSTYPVRIGETTSYTDIDGYDVVGGRVGGTSRVTMYTVRWIDNGTVYVKHLTKQELDETNS